MSRVGWGPQLQSQGRRVSLLGWGSHPAWGGSSAEVLEEGQLPGVGLMSRVGWGPQLWSRGGSHLSLRTCPRRIPWAGPSRSSRSSSAGTDRCGLTAGGGEAPPRGPTRHVQGVLQVERQGAQRVHGRRHRPLLQQRYRASLFHVPVPGLGLRGRGRCPCRAEPSGPPRAHLRPYLQRSGLPGGLCAPAGHGVTVGVTARALCCPVLCSAQGLAAAGSPGRTPGCGAEVLEGEPEEPRVRQSPHSQGSLASCSLSPPDQPPRG